MPSNRSSFATGLTTNDLSAERAKPVSTPWGLMALYLIEGEVLCAAAFCPHLEGPLFEGTISGPTITCPWHQWRFDLRTGQRVGLLGIPLPGDRLVRCAVAFDAAGTIVLSAPNES